MNSSRAVTFAFATILSVAISVQAQSPSITKLTTASQIEQVVAQENTRRAVVLAAAEEDAKAHSPAESKPEAKQASPEAMAAWVRDCVESHEQRIAAIKKELPPESTSLERIDVSALVAAHAQKQALLATLDTAPRRAGHSDSNNAEQTAAASLRAINDQLKPRQTKQ